MRERHTAFYNLLDSVRGHGCPVCSLVLKSNLKFIDGILYESVNDPALRDEIRGSEGFCNRHSWQLRRTNDGFGLGIILDDLMQLIMPRLGRARAGKECIFCREEKEAARRYIRVFLDNFDDPELKIAYKNSFGLCLPHLRIALGECRNRQQAEEILALESGKLAALSAEVKDFLRKRDYRFSSEKTGAESDSWIRAVEKLSGKEGMSG